jgi:hypothetical protein
MHANMPHATMASVRTRLLPRDLRVDVLRGIALIMIFIDHLPGNRLSLITLHSFGFCDAAEMFVLLSGFSSMIAYGGTFDRDGILVGLRRVFLRLVRLYLFQAVPIAGGVCRCVVAPSCHRTGRPRAVRGWRN